MIRITRQKRYQIGQVLIDVCAYLVSLAVMLFVRFDLDPPDRQLRDFWKFLPIAVAVAVIIFGLRAGLLRRHRYGSFEDVAALGAASGVVTAIAFAIDIQTSPRWLPISVVVTGGITGFVGSLAVRYSRRLQVEHRLHPQGESPRRVLLFGAGKAGNAIIQAMVADPSGDYTPVALIDDDDSKQRVSIRGIPVVGKSDGLEEIAMRLRIDELLVCAPTASPDKLREIAVRAEALGLSVKVVPTVGRLLSEAPRLTDIREIRDVDLLGRREIDTNIGNSGDYIKGSVVLVTGAGGSIGSELCRQIARLAPERLLMLDRDESALHGTQLSIEGSAMLDSESIVLCDIRDNPALQAVFAKYRPAIVFHAAALKHLPILERYPSEAFKTNVFGTYNVLQLADQYGAKVLVNISTDKAANPTSILGYSKRVTEQMTAYFGRTKSGTYLSVRFGNVLGSRGSVLETFRDQIDRGIDLTVTDPDVTRYFMTIEEAVQLVIQGGAVGKSGEVLVLDMGEPVRIDDVARILINASGKQLNVRYTGLRPGEKLTEELVGSGDTYVRRAHPLISHYRVQGLDPEDIANDPFLSPEQAKRCLETFGSAIQD
jgi:FlaA1/EpsC-like NDP-sugar epimerase